MERVAVKPSPTTGRWIKARPSGGWVRDVSWNSIVHMLEETGVIDRHEIVERIEMDKDGLHVYLEID